MGVRRTAGDTQAGQQWRAFLGRHESLVATANLPGWIVQTRERWDNFLMHGYLDHHDDPSGFRVESLSDRQLAALRTLAERYFAETDADYTPIALAHGDRDQAT